MYINIVQVLDHYYLAKRNNDTKAQLELADELVARWIPNILQSASETLIADEEDTLG